MNNISISPRFFKTELRNYSNHCEALVRELIQNAVDSPGCRNIQITHSLNFISIKDDGQGMNRDILLNKYLSMGETTKDGGETLGGFGRARTVTNWAQRSYEIISHDYKLCGEGSGYEIHDNPFTFGCEFKINTDQEEWGGIITRYLNKCSFRHNITVNGEVFKSEISRGRWARDLTFGKVWVNKSQQSQLLVRVNGISMFSRFISAPAQIIIEINPEISRDVLLSNRDSLQWEKQKEIEEFCDEISTESLSALKPKINNYFMLMKKGSVFYASPKQTEASQSAAIDSRKSITLEIIGGQPTTGIYQNIESKYEEESRYAEKWLEGTAVAMDSWDEDVKKVAKLYDPETWKGGETRMKLLKIWKMAVELAAECYAEFAKQSVCFGIGFLFSDEAEAQYRKVEGVEYILINPLNKENKMRYSVNKRESLSEILVLATHEICHMASNRHDETFSHSFTQIMKEVMKREGDLWRRVREEK
jgi:hypothetical protein